MALNKKSIVLAVIIFFLTPGIYYSLVINKPILLLTSIFTLSAILAYKKLKLLLVFSLIVFSVIFVYFYQNTLLKQTIFTRALPAETSYLIDKQLSTGVILDSPLITNKLNFNRLAYNKLIFGINEVVKKGVSYFDFEKLVVPSFSYIVLAKSSSREALPQYLDLWQVILLTPTLFVISQKKYRIFAIFLLVATAILFIFGSSVFPLLLPSIALGISLFILNQKKLIRLTIFIIAAISTVFSFSFFISNFDWWMNQNEVVQKRIFHSLVKNNLDGPVQITDRYGIPEHSPMNYSYGAFRFWEIDDKNNLNNIFVGLPGEFLKETQDESKLENGEILDKIFIPRPDVGGLGGEIWIVKKL